jgi:hypothetical protein
MHVPDSTRLEKNLSGVAGQYLVAAELSRRGFIAMPTLRNTRGIDVLASSADGSRAVTIQVKTNQGSERSWMLTAAAEKQHSTTLFYVFVNLNGPGKAASFHVVPSKTVAEFITVNHRKWCAGSKRDGSQRKDTAMRKFFDPNGVHLEAWRVLGLGEAAVE